MNNENMKKALACAAGQICGELSEKEDAIISDMQESFHQQAKEDESKKLKYSFGFTVTITPINNGMKVKTKRNNKINRNSVVESVVTE